MLRKLATTFAVAAALAFPAGALAAYGPTGGPYDTYPGASTSGPVDHLRDGKYVPTPTAASGSAQVLRSDTSPGANAPVDFLRDGKYLPAPTAAGPVEVVRVASPHGFDFRDAGIGALVGAAAIALLAGIAIVTRRGGGRGRGTAGAAHAG